MRLLSLALLTVTLVGSCSGERRVEVSDPTGKPVAGVRLRPVHEVFVNPTAVTDAQGRAVVQTYGGIGPVIVPVTYILVDKEGFASQSVKLPDKWPLKIVLEPDRKP